MRVTVISDHLFPYAHGGGERVYRVLADTLVERGAQVRYLTRAHWPADTVIDTPFETVPIWSGEVYDSRGTRRIGAALRWSAAVLRALWREHADVLVVSATPVFNVFAATIAQLAHPRSVILVDWLEIWPARKWRSYSGALAGSIAWLLQSCALRLGRARMVNSETTRERLPRRFRSEVLMLPLNTLAGPPISADDSTPNSVEDTLLFVGRQIPDKNLALLPPVLARLATERPRIAARIVGEGPERARVEVHARELGVADRITFLGRVSDEDLERELAAAATLFFPSVREGFGLVVCEAARMGTPVVVVDHPDNAAAALVTPTVNGEIAEAATVEAVAAAVERSLGQGSQLRMSARNWYRYSWTRSGGFAQLADQIVALASRDRQRSASQ